MMSRVILIGGGGFARELICWARDSEVAGGFPKITGFIDDNLNALDDFSYGIPCLGQISNFQPEIDDMFLMGIATPAIKRKIVSTIGLPVDRYLTLIHPTAIVAFSAVLGHGVVICPKALISADVKIGNLCAVNAMSSIGHDSVLGDYTTLSAHVDVTGQVLVGQEVFFGTSSATVPRIKIGNKSKIGAGSLIMRNVADEVVMYSSPAKKLF